MRYYIKHILLLIKNIWPYIDFYSTCPAFIELYTIWFCLDTQIIKHNKPCLLNIAVCLWKEKWRLAYLIKLKLTAAIEGSSLPRRISWAYLLHSSFSVLLFEYRKECIGLYFISLLCIGFSLRLEYLFSINIFNKYYIW